MEVTQDPTTAELERFVRGFYEDVETKRLDRIAAAIDGTIQQLDERTGVWARDRGGLIEGYVEELTGAERFHNWIEDVDVRLLDERVGVVTLVWYTDAVWDGTDYHIRCPSTILARRADGGWRIVLIHSVPMEDRSGTG